jgi:hypothetical protein
MLMSIYFKKTSKFIQANTFFTSTNMKQFLLVGFAFISLSAIAQNHPLFTSSGAKSLGLANNSSQHSDVWSNFNNQAGLGNLETSEAAVFVENRFFQHDINTMGFASALPTKSGVFGVSYKRFGLADLFVQSNTSLNYGRKLSDRFNLGGGFSYLSTFIGNNYGRTGALAVHLGVMAKLSDNLHLSGHLSNMNRAKLAEFHNERYPSFLTVGLKYIISEKVDVLGEVSKDVNHKPSMRGAVDYHLNNVFALRCGAATNPTLFSFGLGYKKQAFSMDIGASLHQVLGLTSNLTLGYTFGK